MSLNGVRAICVGCKLSVKWFIPLQYFLNLLQPLTVAVPVYLAAGISLITLGTIYSCRERLLASGMILGKVY